MQIGLVTASQYKGGALQVQVDDYGGKDAGVPFGDVHWISGIGHRPLDPELDADDQPIPAKAAQVLYIWEGGRLHVIPSWDPRVAATAPQLTKGSTVVTTKSGTFLLLDGETGDVTVYVPSGGQAHLLQIQAGGDISLLHGSGAGLELVGSNVVLHSGNGSNWIQVSNDGITLGGNVKVAGALSGPVTPPLPLLTSPTTPAAFISGF